MIAGKVVGSVISTRKCENLVGNKFMIVDGSYADIWKTTHCD